MERSYKSYVSVATFYRRHMQRLILMFVYLGEEIFQTGVKACSFKHNFEKNTIHMYKYFPVNFDDAMCGN